MVAHKTSLRALRKHLEGISDQHIAGMTIRTGEPLAYQLDENMRPLWHRSLSPGGTLKRWSQAALGRWIQKKQSKVLS